MNRFRKLLAGALAIIMLAVTLPTAFAAEEGEKHLTIVGTTDLHSNIWGYSYEDNKETANNGMARVYSYLQSVRAENPNVVLVDAGDFIQGTILSDDIYNKSEGDHPVITAMNAMDYDAIILGNHEFNSSSSSATSSGVSGIELIQRIEKLSEAPVLAANIKFKNGDHFADDYAIVERSGVKIGIIGLGNPDIPRWEGEKVDELTFEAVGTAARRVVDEIKDQCDVLVAVAHVGVNAEYDEDNGSDAAAKIVELCPEIDVLMVGHQHITVNETIGTTVVGGCRKGGREVARFDLTLDKDNKVVDSKVDIVLMDEITPSEELRSIPFIKEAHEKTISYIQGGGSGEGGAAGGSALGTTTAKFQPANEIRDLPEGKLQDTAVMDLINQVQLENSGADVSAAALFKDTSDLPEGNINYGNIFDIYKFDNTLYTVKVTGKELKAYMEWAAECYNQWVPGDINISFDPEYPGYLYDMFAGVDYEINLSKPKGERIENVMFKGKPLSDTQTLTLAVNNYRYSSALKAKNLVEGKREWESPNSIRDMLLAYFAEHSPVEPKVDNNWKITGVDLSQDDPKRAELVKYINMGLLEAPYGKSYNLADYDALVAQAKAYNAVLNGKCHTLDVTDVDQNGTETFYFRLRDLAVALKGTANAFNVEWNKATAQVVITKGGEYTAEALLPAKKPVTNNIVDLTVLVDGAPVTVQANLVGGNNYVTAEGVAALLGVQAGEADGVLLVGENAARESH